MIDPKTLSGDLAVCAFVPPKALATLSPRFRTIINNRPDAEEEGQPSSAELEAEARRLGLEYVHIPVVPGQVTDDQVAAFGNAMRNRPGPTLAFCRTGKRAATLWALSQAGKLEPDAIIQAAAAAGFDLTELKPKLLKKMATH